MELFGGCHCTDSGWCGTYTCAGVVLNCSPDGRYHRLLFIVQIVLNEFFCFYFSFVVAFPILFIKFSSVFVCLFIVVAASVRNSKSAVYTLWSTTQARSTQASQHRWICNTPISIYGQCGPCGFRLYPFYCKIMRWKFVTIFTATFGWLDALLLHNCAANTIDRPRRAEDTATTDL